jgi:hypothetical protein
MSADEPRYDAARTIIDRLEQGPIDSDKLIDWLLGDLPHRQGVEEPYQAFTAALATIGELVRDPIPIRNALARDVANLIAADPEADPNVPNKAVFLFNLYKVATALYSPNVLGATLAAAITRGVRRLRYFGDPVERFLLSAAIVNQHSDALEGFWLSLLGSRAECDRWGVVWLDAWDGVRLMPGRNPYRRGSYPVPSFQALSRALPHVSKLIEEDFPDSCERAERFRALITRLSNTWPGYIGREHIIPLVVGTDCPVWAIGAVAEGLPEDPRFASVLDKIRRDARNRDFQQELLGPPLTMKQIFQFAYNYFAAPGATMTIIRLLSNVLKYLDQNNYLSGWDGNPSSTPSLASFRLMEIFSAATGPRYFRPSSHRPSRNSSSSI